MALVVAGCGSSGPTPEEVMASENAGFYEGCDALEIALRVTGKNTGTGNPEYQAQLSEAARLADEADEVSLAEEIKNGVNGPFFAYDDCIAQNWPPKF